MRRAATLVIATCVLSGCAATGPAPTVAPPGATFALPTPSVAATRTAPPGRPAFLVTTPTGLAVRTEANDRSFGTVAMARVAVSPDGRSVAGWAGDAERELRVAEVTRPGAPTTMVTLPPGERGGSVSWSVDGGGLLYSVTAAAQTPPYGALRSVEPGSAPRELLREDGATLRPLVWHRREELAAALLVQDGAAREVIVARTGVPLQRRTLPPRAWREVAAVSGDGGWIAIVAADAPLLRLFPIDAPGFVHETQGTGVVQALGRPWSHDIAVLIDGDLALWDPLTGQRRRIAGEVVELRFFRADGSAIVLRTARGTVLLEIESGQVSPVPDGAVLGVSVP